MIVWLSGVNNSFYKILKQDNNENKLLQMVYKDPSIMINEITPENFDLFIARMGGKNGGVEALPVVKAEPLKKDLVREMKGGRKGKGVVTIHQY